MHPISMLLFWGALTHPRIKRSLLTRAVPPAELTPRFPAALTGVIFKYGSLGMSGGRIAVMRLDRLPGCMPPLQHKPQDFLPKSSKSRISEHPHAQQSRIGIVSWKPVPENRCPPDDRIYYILPHPEPASVPLLTRRRHGLKRLWGPPFGWNRHRCFATIHDGSACSDAATLLCGCTLDEAKGLPVLLLSGASP